jgi:RHS repeat-associated protein
MQDSVIGGLYYIGTRWMNPEFGRWLSLDPELGKLSAPQTQNRYVYCVNNPLRFTDPTGEGLFKWLKENWKTVVVAIAVVAITVATGGIGGIVAGALLGAAMDVSIYAGTAAVSGERITLEGIAASAVSGAISGAVGSLTGGLGSGVAKGALKIAGKYSLKMGPVLTKLGTVIGEKMAVKIGVSSLLGSIGGDLSYLGREAVETAIPGGEKGSISAEGLIWHFGTGGIAGGATGAVGGLDVPGVADVTSRTVGGAMREGWRGMMYTGIQQGFFSGFEKRLELRGFDV